jgi:hypothetical protein
MGRLLLGVGLLAALAGCPPETCATCNTGGGSAFGGGTGFGGGSGTGAGGGNTTGSVTITGRVTYDFVPSTYSATTKVATLQFAQATRRPARNVLIQVMQGNTMIGSGWTTEDGVYTVGYTPSGTSGLAVYAATKSQSPSISVVDNTDSKLLWAVGAQLTGQSQTVDLVAQHGWTGSSFDNTKRNASPFAILDSMYTATKAFTTARPALVFPPLKVNWSPNNVPQAGDKTMGQISTSHYSPSEGEIYVLGKDGVDTDEFDSHVIVHEWGHFFEAKLSRSDSPGGRHGPGDVLDPRIAFGEAWGNSVAAMVLPETMYTDTNWSNAGLTGFGFDAETTPNPTDDPTPSAFSESSVLRLLYDIYDGSNEPFDQFGVGLGPIADVLTGPEKTTDAVTTLASFVSALKAQPGVNAGALDTLMAHYLVGPITTQWGDGDNGNSGLRSMFTDAPMPFTGSVSLGGGNSANSWQQNQYYVFTGNGGTVSVSATSNQDVSLVVYRVGQVVASADALNVGGTETCPVSSQSGAKYVVVLTGYGPASAGDYPVDMSIR